MIGCRKCKGLFVGSEEMGNHETACAGNPFKSPCQYFACERKIYLQLFQSEDFQEADELDLPVELTKAVGFLSQDEDEKLQAEIESATEFLHNQQTTHNESDHFSKNSDYMLQPERQEDTDISKAIDFVEDMDVSKTEPIISKENLDLQEIINENINYLKSGKASEFLPSTNEPRLQSPFDRQLSRHLSFIDDTTLLKSRLHSPFEKSGGFMQYGNEPGFHGSSLTYSSNPSIPFSCNLATDLLSSYASTQEETQQALSSNIVECPTLQYLDLAKKDPFLGQNLGLQTQVNSKDPFLINASVKQLSDQKYPPQLIKSSEDLQEQASPPFQLQDSNYFNFPSTLDEPTQLDYLDLATLDLLTNPCLPGFGTGYSKDRLPMERDDAFSEDGIVSHEPVSLPMDHIFGKPVNGNSNTIFFSNDDQLNPFTQGKSTKRRLTEEKKPIKEKIRAVRKNRNSTPKKNKVKSDSKEIIPTTTVKRTRKDSEKSTSDIGKQSKILLEKIKMFHHMPVKLVRNEKKETTRKQVPKLCPQDTSLNIKDQLVGYTDEEKATFKAVLAESGTIIVKKQKMKHDKTDIAESSMAKLTEPSLNDTPCSGTTSIGGINSSCPNNNTGSSHTNVSNSCLIGNTDSRLSNTSDPNHVASNINNIRTSHMGTTSLDPFSKSIHVGSSDSTHRKISDPSCIDILDSSLHNVNDTSHIAISSLDITDSSHICVTDAFTADITYSSHVTDVSHITLTSLCNFSDSSCVVSDSSHVRMTDSSFSNTSTDTSQIAMTSLSNLSDSSCIISDSSHVGIIDSSLNNSSGTSHMAIASFSDSDTSSLINNVSSHFGIGDSSHVISGTSNGVISDASLIGITDSSISNIPHTSQISTPDTSCVGISKSALGSLTELSPSNISGATCGSISDTTQICVIESPDTSNIGNIESSHNNIGDSSFVSIIESCNIENIESALDNFNDKSHIGLSELDKCGSTMSPCNISETSHNEIKHMIVISSVSDVGITGLSLSNTSDIPQVDITSGSNINKSCHDYVIASSLNKSNNSNHSNSDTCHTGNTDSTVIDIDDTCHTNVSSLVTSSNSSHIQNEDLSQNNSSNLSHINHEDLSQNNISNLSHIKIKDLSQNYTSGSSVANSDPSPCSNTNPSFSDINSSSLPAIIDSSSTIISDPSVRIASGTSYSGITPFENIYDSTHGNVVDPTSNINDASCSGIISLHNSSDSSCHGNTDSQHSNSSSSLIGSARDLSSNDITNPSLSHLSDSSIEPSPCSVGTSPRRNTIATSAGSATSVSGSSQPGVSRPPHVITVKVKSETPKNVSLITSQNNMSMKCTQCDFVCANVNVLKTHFYTHSKDFVCDQCGDRFSTKTSLTNHETKKHNAEFRYACTKCDYKTPRKQGLKDHMAKHDGNYVYCDVDGCEFKTIYRRVLTKHKGTHTGGRRFYCDQCTLSFNDSAALRRHLNQIHMSCDKYFKCSECEYCSALREDVVKHYKVRHLQLKNYHCNQCDFKTGYTNKLRLHIMAHAGIQPYKCSACTYQVNDSFRVERHIRTVHTDKTGVKVVKMDLPFELASKDFKCRDNDISSADINIIEITKAEMEELKSKFDSKKPARRKNTPLKSVTEKESPGDGITTAKVGPVLSERPATIPPKDTTCDIKNVKSADNSPRSVTISIKNGEKFTTNKPVTDTNLKHCNIPEIDNHRYQTNVCVSDKNLISATDTLPTDAKTCVTDNFGKLSLANDRTISVKSDGVSPTDLGSESMFETEDFWAV